MRFAAPLSAEALAACEEFHATDLAQWLDEEGFTPALYFDSGDAWHDVTVCYREAFAQLVTEGNAVLRLPVWERTAAAAARKARRARA